MIITAYRIKKFIIDYLSMHIFLSLISLPIIIAWGLPSSWLSFLGNLIFNPLLFLFLLLSSLGFFSELIGLPHQYIDWSLEQLTRFWQWLLTLAPSHVLYGFYAPSWWFLFFIALIALVSVIHPLLRHPIYRFIALTFFFILSTVILYAHKPRSLLHHMPCNQGSVTIIHTNNKTIVIDPGYIGSRISANSWILYTFLPELVAKTGSLSIDHLILLKPTVMTFSAIDTLVQNSYIHHLYFPSMQGTLEGSLSRAFKKLYAHIKQNNIPITRLYGTKFDLFIDDTTHFSIQANSTASYQTICYPHLHLEGFAQGVKIDITGR